MKKLIIVLSSLVLSTSVFAYEHMAGAAPAAKAVAAPKPTAGAKVTTTKSLYDRLGRKAAITAVVEDFVPRAAADPKVNFFRDGKYKSMDVTNLKNHLVTFISMASGGPKEYAGRDMTATHTGMKITSDEFNAIAGHLAASLKKLNVPAKETGELMAIAASTKPAMVGK